MRLRCHAISVQRGEKLMRGHLRPEDEHLWRIQLRALVNAFLLRDLDLRFLDRLLRRPFRLLPSGGVAAL